MSKMSKDDVDKYALAGAKTLRPKMFDTRILDRMEGYCGQYRHWLQSNHDMPHEYAEQQRETYRQHLRETCTELLARLANVN